jgi:23S rRNA pseudouridine2605 synthase
MKNIKTPRSLSAPDAISGAGVTHKLQKVLAGAGIGSRRAMEELIAGGQVTVNGRVATIGQRVGVNDRIKVGSRLIKMAETEESPEVLLYHKPEGEIVSNEDPQGRTTVFDRLPKAKRGKWLAIGRLDFNTSGLLIFTTSGDLANRLMHPRFGVDREYAVRVLGNVTESALSRLRSGVVLEDGEARFETLEEEGGEGANRWFRVQLREGRNRVVRRLFESQGLTVSRLMRVRFGMVVLPPQLKRGQVLRLNERDVSSLMAWASSEQGAEPVSTVPSAPPARNRPRRSSKAR